MSRTYLFSATAAIALSLSTAPALPADLFTSDNDGYVYDYQACLELARREGNVIKELAALHPVLKHEPGEAVAAHAKELKMDRKDLHRARRYWRCI